MRLDKFELDENLRKYFRETDKKDAFVILLNGKRVMMSNGKSTWASTGAAKNALHNNLNYAYDKYGEDAVKEWVKFNIQIVSIGSVNE